MKNKIIDFILVALIVPILIGFYAVETNYRGIFRTPTPTPAHASVATLTPTPVTASSPTPTATPRSTQTRTLAPSPTATSTRVFTLQLPPAIHSSDETGAQ